MDIKKIRVPLLVAGGIVLLACLYFFFIKPANVYDAIPANAIAVLETGNWEKFANKLSTTATGSELKKTTAGKLLLDEVSAIRGLFGADQSLASSMLSDRMAISLHLTAAEDFDYLFSSPESSIDEKMLINGLQSSKKVKALNVRNFRNQNVVDVTLANGTQFCFAKLKGVFVFSFTPFLTENAVNSILSGNSLSADKAFKKAKKKYDSGGDASLFVHYGGSEIIMPVSIKPTGMPLLKDFSNYAGWGAYAVSFSNDALSLVGMAATQPTEEVEGNVLKSNIFSFIPDNAAYVQFSANPVVSQKKKKKDVIEEHGMIKGYFEGWTGKGHAFVTMEPLKEDYAQHNVFVIEVQDREKAKATLLQMVKVEGSPVIAIDTFNGNPVYSFKSGDIINQDFGNSITACKTCFFTIEKDVAIFGNNLDVLQLVVEKLDKKETLKSELILGPKPEELKPTGSIVYLNPGRSSLLMKAIVKDSSSLKNFLSSFTGIFISSKRDGELIRSNIVFRANGGSDNGAGLLWKTKLQYASIYTPQVVTGNNGEKEIFAQDTANNIYLLSKSGEIIFSKNIDGTVQGGVSTIDYYNSGQMGFIFNTREYVYIIDEQGNFVGSYPLRLSANATAGLTLIQDEASGRYKFFVPCSNGAVYGYEGNGRPLPGWSPHGGTGIISKPLQAIKMGRSTGLLAFNDAGKLMLLDSKGPVKWSVDNLPVSDNNFVLVQNRDGFVALNAAGKQLVEITADGNDNIHPLIDSAGSFAAVNTSDSTYQYFYSSEAAMRSYNQKNEFINSIADKAVIKSIKVLKEGQNTWLLVQEPAIHKVEIFDIALKHKGEYTFSATGIYNIADLFSQGELIGLGAEPGGYISCYRIR